MDVPSAWNVRDFGLPLERCVRISGTTAPTRRPTAPRSSSARYSPITLRRHPAWQRGPAEIAGIGGADRRSGTKLRDCHQSKQLTLLRLLEAADLHVCTPGRTRTCTLRIRKSIHGRPCHLAGYRPRWSGPVVRPARTALSCGDVPGGMTSGMTTASPVPADTPSLGEPWVARRPGISAG